MSNIISANVSEEVEKIPIDMKKVLTNVCLKFTHITFSATEYNIYSSRTTHVAS